jgi:hypothetical protein
MSLVRLVCLLFVAVLLFPKEGWCASPTPEQCRNSGQVNVGQAQSKQEKSEWAHDFTDSLQRQVAERARQYQETLRQRAQQLSPSLQARIESQVQQTVAKGLATWNSGGFDGGEWNIQIALPHWAEAWRVARFVARHLPFSGFPAGSFEFGIGAFPVAVVVPLPQFLKSLSSSAAHCAIIPSLAGNLSRQRCEVISYFVRIASTIVQRQ